MLDDVESDRSKLAVLPLEIEEKTTIVEAVDEVLEDRSLEMQAIVEILSGGEEVARVTDRSEERNVKAQVPASLRSPTINATEVGRYPPSTPVNNPLHPSVFKVSHHVSTLAPPLCPLFV